MANSKHDYVRQAVAPGELTSTGWRAVGTRTGKGQREQRKNDRGVSSETLSRHDNSEDLQRK